MDDEYLLSQSVVVHIQMSSARLLPSRHPVALFQHLPINIFHMRVPNSRTLGLFDRRLEGRHVFCYHF